MDIAVGDLLHMKKQHPCGCDRWRVLRVGMDFRLRCEGCGREVLRPRAKVERAVKKICHARDGCDKIDGAGAPPGLV
ncbi:MAG: DUF951 domain-containing protein [Oscillospiraceae bacterium]|nr:DUF951 domain-containing protein [Oscillospiraceae bacterium]